MFKVLERSIVGDCGNGFSPRVKIEDKLRVFIEGVFDRPFRFF